MSDLIIVVLIFIAIIAFFDYLEKKEKKKFKQKIEEDEQIDYENGIEIFKIDKNGIDYLESSYKDYQQNKENMIKKLFTPGMIINWQNAQWEVISTPEHRYEDNDRATKYEKRTNYYYVKVRYISKMTEQGGDFYNYGVISEISDSKFYDSDIHIENQVETKNELVKKIDEFLRIDENGSDGVLELKKELKLLKYEILNNEVDAKEIPKLVEKMKKFSHTTAPFASLLSAIIGLAQKFVN